MNQVEWQKQIREAENYMNLARDLASRKHSNGLLICNYVHLAILLYLKICVRFYSRLPKRADIDNITLMNTLSMCITYDCSFKKLHKNCQTIAPFAVELNYLESVQLTLKDARKLVKMGEKIEQFIKARLHPITKIKSVGIVLENCEELIFSPEYITNLVLGGLKEEKSKMFGQRFTAEEIFISISHAANNISAYKDVWTNDVSLPFTRLTRQSDITIISIEYMDESAEIIYAAWEGGMEYNLYQKTNIDEARDELYISISPNNTEKSSLFVT